ncbi:integral membrane protein [Cladophialophora carrionii]|uniref:Integral membrane protein n=1 Tax=Cladophialophora carrionii TaxID=86049 RepID=A0A1C1CN84_9EURO|nr:integral membrane protein [Cladophialophora carrionii]
MVDTLHLIATWPKPNYVDPDTRGPGLIYVCIVFGAIGIITGLARLYSRLFITKAPGLDDLLVMVALGFLTALTVLVIIGNKDFYSGRHVWDIPPSSFVGGRINIWASLWCYVIGITLIKISVLLFYRRLSVKFSKAFLIATWIGIIYNILYFVSFGLTLLLLCRPLHAYWDSFNPVWAATHHFHCASENAALPASSAFSVAGDFYSTLLPLILVYYLELPRRQKFALYALFALGFMAVAAGVVRTVLMYQLLNVEYDFTWELWLTWVWAVVELYLALFAASAPSLKPFFQHFFVDSISSFARSSRRRRDYGQTSGPGHELPAKDVEQGMYGTEGQHQHQHKQHPSRPRPDVDRGTNRLTWITRDERSVSQQSWFRGDTSTTGGDGTRHLELRPTEDGKKMIPMRVYGRDGRGGVAESEYSSSGASGATANPFSDTDTDTNTVREALDRDRDRDRDRERSDSNLTMTALPQSRHDWPLPGLGSEPQHQPREFLANPRLSMYDRNI